MSLANLTDGVRHARWLTRARVIAGGQVLLLIQVTILVLIALWQHGVINGQVSPTSSDFVSFYAAGKLALAGTPALTYDQAAHFLAEQQFTVNGAPYQFFFYPPVFLLLCAPLALLPYSVAFYAFEIATLTGFLMAARKILDQHGWTWIASVLAFPAVFWTFGLGQNAYLTAALFGSFTLLIDRRPVLAGVLLGLICYKPHFGLLAPVALIAGGHWRALFAAGATVATVIGVSAFLFGMEAWHAWFAAISASDTVYASGRIDYAGIVTPFGAARLLGLDPVVSYYVQAGVTVLMISVVALVWKRRGRRSVRAAILLSGTVLAAPLVLLYDNMLLLIAIIWLVRDARRHGFLPWEKSGLLTLYLLLVVEYPIGSAWHLPLGPVVSFAVALLAVRRSFLIEGARQPVPTRSAVSVPGHSILPT